MLTRLLTPKSKKHLEVSEKSEWFPQSDPEEIRGSLICTFLIINYNNYLSFKRTSSGEREEEGRKEGRKEGGKETYVFRMVSTGNPAMSPRKDFCTADTTKAPELITRGGKIYNMLLLYNNTAFLFI